MAVIGGLVELESRTVLVGVDGSDGSRAAVHWVKEMRGDAELDIVAVSVEQPFLEWSRPDSPDNWRRGAEKRILEDYASELVEAGVPVRALAVRGSNAAESLMEAAEGERADLVVIGTRGLGGFIGLRVGGVTLKALHRADRPIVLVPIR